MDPFKSRLQGGQIRNHHPDVASEHLRVTRREVKLLLANVHPHIARPDHHIWVAGQAEAGDIKGRSNRLVRNGDIHMFHPNDIPDILRGTIIRFLVLHSLPSLPDRKSTS